MKFNTYQKVALTTVGATIFLIFVGGLVRASGAGLGCPDWPKCFGMWIPPLSASELPAGYDASSFNVLKTWTEYINRLIGVIIGLLIIATFTLSFKYRKEEPSVFYSSAASFALVLVQGWLGGRVVISGLDEWLITLHMILAMIIMMALIYSVYKASKEHLELTLSNRLRSKFILILGFLIFVTFIQLILGTQVREAVDVFKNMSVTPPRDLWISKIGFMDEMHRTFSWLVFIAGAVLFYICGWQANNTILKKIGTGIFGLILLQIISGIVLYYFAIPPVFQVIHLVGVALLIAFEFVMVLLVQNSKQGGEHIAQSY